jgi:glycosyltransferase involved in cell wall biosynthesis
MSIGRLACFGVIEEGAGSVATADYMLVRELARRGVSVDQIANAAHHSPPKGLPAKSFRYRGFTPPLSERLVDSLPDAPSWVAERLSLPLLNVTRRRVYQPPAEATHAEAPYDALLGLGMIAPFGLSGAPTVTWLQSPLSTELEAIRRLREQIVAARGWPFYATLVAAYRYSGPILQRSLRSSERIIVGSEWSRQAMIGDGFDAARVHALPYGIDLDLFRPAEGDPEVDWEAPSILSLGRLDPRKRLDLLLEAFRVVLLEHPGATLRIVGRSGYTPKQLSLIERFPSRDRVHYQPEIPRGEVPDLLRASAVLVQASENENFGSSVAEALACGTPVVAGPSNGTAEYTDAGSTDGASQLFDRYTPEAMAEAIVRALRVRKEDPQGARESARAAAERWFDPAEITDRLIEVIEAARSQ